MSYLYENKFNKNKFNKLKACVLEDFKNDYDEPLIRMAMAQVKQNKKLLLKHRYRLTDCFKKVIKNNLEILKSEYIPPNPQENEAIFEGSSAQAFSKNLADQLETEARHIRERIFDDPEPPFKSKSQAISWIKEQHKLEPEDRLITVVVDRETTEELHTPLDPTTPDNPKSIKVLGVKTFDRDFISFPGPGSCSNSLPISSHGGNHWSTKLAKLAFYSKKLSKFTGWQEQQASMFILTGLIPLLPPARITIYSKSHRAESDDWISYQYATVSFFGFYMTKKELIKLHAKLREMVGLKHKKKLESEQKELVDFVKDKARTLKYSSAPEFWEKLAAEWAALRGKGSKNGNSFYKRYSRICENLNINQINPKRKKRG